MEQQGKIIFIGEKKNVSTTDKEFFVMPFGIQWQVEVNYTPYDYVAGFQATGALIDKVEKMNVGDEIKVFFGLAGTLKSKKETVSPTEKNPEAYECYTNLRVGRIDLVSAVGSNHNPTIPSNPAPTTENVGADDLPF